MDAIRGGLALAVAKCQTGVFENRANDVLGGSQAFKKVLIFLMFVLRCSLIDWYSVQGSMGYSGRVDTSFWVRIHE